MSQVATAGQSFVLALADAGDHSWTLQANSGLKDGLADSLLTT